MWHLNPRLTLKGGNGYRTPPLKQADGNLAEPSGDDGRSRDPGNSALRPERSTSYGLGLVCSGESAAQFGATLFHSHCTDRISRVDLCRRLCRRPARRGARLLVSRRGLCRGDAIYHRRRRQG